MGAREVCRSAQLSARQRAVTIVSTEARHSSNLQGTSVCRVGLRVCCLLREISGGGGCVVPGESGLAPLDAPPGRVRGRFLPLGT